MIANGPMLLHNDFTVSQNSKSLTTLIDTFWVDQPVGAGFSTVDSDGYAKDENDVTNDFIGFLSNLVKIFPSLATRPLYLAGEDYASIYISYISKALMTSSNSPVMLQKIAIGNGMFYDPSVSANLATLSIAESFPQLIKFEQSTFAAFQSKYGSLILFVIAAWLRVSHRSHLCGYDVNLTYPQQSVLPSIQSADRISPVWKSVAARETTDGLLQRRRYSPLTTKRQSLSLSDALDPNYGCSLFDELVDYAGNFSFPWTPGVFDLYDVADVVQPQPSIDGGIYFNSLQVRGALHGPFSKNWTSIDQYPFGSTLNFSSATNFFGDPSPPPATFFQDLVNAAASKNVELVLYSSGNNAIAHHRSLENSSVLIQNTTFGGTRGFTRKPSTHWVDDNGNVAGIVHQERGIVYALFDNIGSLTPFTNPTAAYTFFRQFVLSSNTTGSITVDSKNHVVVLGGEDPDAADDAPRVASEIFLGATTTQSTLVAPSATIAAWVGFLENATGGAQASTSGADSRLALSAGGLWLGVLGTLGVAWAL
ncbi:alpha/beta-hydrolase [Gloeopeniophorella convolvens]|nr:alpha/beta-hydrolase [Gloeopeniophorella convolvens]